MAMLELLRIIKPKPSPADELRAEMQRALSDLRAAEAAISEALEPEELEYGQLQAKAAVNRVRAVIRRAKQEADLPLRDLDEWALPWQREEWTRTERLPPVARWLVSALGLAGWRRGA